MEYNYCMTKEEFAQTIERFLNDRPGRIITRRVGFGPFKRKIQKRFFLSDLTLIGYQSFIEKNYQGFEKPEGVHGGIPTGGPTILHQAIASEDDESATLYSLSDSKNLHSSIEIPEEIRKILTQRVTGETFSDMLIRLQNERSIKAPDLYRSAGIDYRHFSKIISDRQYRPRKDTVFALGLALRLDIDTAEKFLARAGYSFNPSSLADMTIRFFFEIHKYDRNTIDTLMEAMGLPLLPQNW